jgi:hypothetical protein
MPKTGLFENAFLDSSFRTDKPRREVRKTISKFLNDSQAGKEMTSRTASRENCSFQIRHAACS